VGKLITRQKVSRIIRMSMSINACRYLIGVGDGSIPFLCPFFIASKPRRLNRMLGLIG